MIVTMLYMYVVCVAGPGCKCYGLRRQQKCGDLVTLTARAASHNNNNCSSSTKVGGDRHLLVLLMLCGFNVAQNDILELTNVLWTFKNCNKVGKYADDPEATTVRVPR